MRNLLTRNTFSSGLKLALLIAVIAAAYLLIKRTIKYSPIGIGFLTGYGYDVMNGLSYAVLNTVWSIRYVFAWTSYGIEYVTAWSIYYAKVAAAYTTYYSELYTGHGMILPVFAVATMLTIWGYMRASASEQYNSDEEYA